MSSLMDAYTLLHEGSLALARAERQGIRIDVDVCFQKTQELAQKQEEAKKRLAASELGRLWTKTFGEKADFNSNSQLSKVLYSTMGLSPPKMTAKENGSTDEESLLALGVDGVEDLLAMRRYLKIRSTYLESYLREQVDGFIHPFFSLHTVVTYRSSSSNPNLQNVPVRDEEAKQYCRSVLFPRKGHQMVEVDFSGVEVSAAAAYHKDPEMLRYLKDKSSDMHADQAYVLFILDPYDEVIKREGFKKNESLAKMRQAAKNGFVFPQFYGDYYVNCAKNLACNWGGLPSSRRWKKGDGLVMPDGIRLGEHLARFGIRDLTDYTEHVRKAEDEFWNRRFKVYNAWKKRWVADYQKTGFIKMLTGFQCKGVMRRNEAVNYPIQGVAFHWLLWTLIQIDKWIMKENKRSRIIGEVHDSMILDVHPDELEEVVRKIRHCVSHHLPSKFDWINVPLSVEVKAADVDRPWAEMKLYA